MELVLSLGRQTVASKEEEGQSKAKYLIYSFQIHHKREQRVCMVVGESISSGDHAMTEQGWITERT